jgi:hypothetical protein
VTGRIPLDELNSDQLDALYEQLEAALQTCASAADAVAQEGARRAATAWSPDEATAAAAWSDVAEFLRHIAANGLSALADED